MKLIRREVLTGALAGKVEIEYDNERGRRTSFITAIGSDADIYCRPTTQALTGRRFETHTEEYNVKRRGMKPGTPQTKISQEFHDKTGKTAKAWTERGGKYGRFVDHRGTVIQGPVFRNDAERKPYIALYNSLNRLHIHEG